MTATRINDPSFYEEHDDLLGISWGPIIGTGIGVGTSLLSSAGKPKGPKPPGAGEIDAMVASYHQAEAARLGPMELLNVATQIRSALDGFTASDGYVQQAKATFDNTIRVLSQQAVAQGVTVDPATGQITQAAGDSIISGVSNTTLLIGAGLVGVFLMTRK